MVSEGQRRMRRIWVVIILFTMGLMPVAGISDLPAQADEPPQEMEELQQWVYDQGYNYTVAENWISQLSPEERETLCGYKQVEAPEGPLPENLGFFSNVPTIETRKFGLPPASYDAMALGYVTPIKNQSSPLSCGSCWLHAAMADFESDVAIGESSLLDFSEQEAGDCNIWSSVGGYDFCQGGNALMTTNYFTKYGSADETCHPYAATPQSCYGCPLLKNVDNWRMITGSDGNESKHINTIKNAILNYGPVYSSIYANGPGFDTYSSGVYEDWSPGSTNHVIEIIGWDDTIPWSTGTGAWMIKNSWGTDWGASGPYPGCAWVAYGAANLGDETSAICGYGNPPHTIFYHDECGWMSWFMGDGVNPTFYGAVRFTPSQDLTLTAVDFWAVDVNMNYEIRIFGTLTDLGSSNYAFSSQLGTTQTGSTNEQGYYSIPLSRPVPLTGGDDFIVQVKLTTSTPGHFWPMPIDYYTTASHPWLPAWSGIATFSNESYGGSDGAQFKPSPYDVGIRARAQLVAPDLVVGWNLMSLPLIPYSTDITDIINADNLASGNMDNVDLVYYFDTASETWLWWNGAPASTLTTMEDGLGYWMLMSGADILTVQGTQVGDPPPEYGVIVGWNMIGFTSTTAMAPAVYLASAAGDYTLLYGWDAVGETWLWWNGAPASTLTTMEPGDGYWILMDNPGTITPP